MNSSWGTTAVHLIWIFDWSLGAHDHRDPLIVIRSCRIFSLEVRLSITSSSFSPMKQITQLLTTYWNLLYMEQCRRVPCHWCGRGTSSRHSNRALTVLKPNLPRRLGYVGEARILCQTVSSIQPLLTTQTTNRINSKMSTWHSQSALRSYCPEHSKTFTPQCGEYLKSSNILESPTSFHPKMNLYSLGDPEITPRFGQGVRQWMVSWRYFYWTRRCYGASRGPA